MTQPIHSPQHSFPQKAVTSPEAAAAPLIDAKSARRDVVAVMMALHSYGDLTFATACKVLIYEFSEL